MKVARGTGEPCFRSRRGPLALSKLVGADPVSAPMGRSGLLGRPAKVSFLEPIERRSWRSFVPPTVLRLCGECDHADQRGAGHRARLLGEEQRTYIFWEVRCDSVGITVTLYAIDRHPRGRWHSVQCHGNPSVTVIPR